MPHRHLTICLIPLLALSACTKSGNPPSAPVSTTVKLSQYENAAYCDLAVASDNTLHALFTDSPDHAQPARLYYRSSTDAGHTWSNPLTLSDDPSVSPVGYARILIDTKNRIYAIWKYYSGASNIEGPGGAQEGAIIYRCLDHGTWSDPITLNTKPQFAFSFFAALDPQGNPNIIWSQLAPDAALANIIPPSGAIANLVRQATLDGTTITTTKDLTTSPPITTRDQWHDKGINSPTLAQLSPHSDGYINLRGYIAPDNSLHFIGERPKPQSLLYFDGSHPTPIYTYIPFRNLLTFDNPATLLIDAAGKPHLIRAPESSGTPSICDYSITDSLSQPTTIFAPKDPAKGNIFNWQAIQLPHGKMAVLCGLSETAQIRPADEELYISYSDGNNKWTPPQKITDNVADSASKSGAAPGYLVTDHPKFTSLVLDNAGHPCLLLINTIKTVVVKSNPATTLPANPFGDPNIKSAEITQVLFQKLPPL